MDITIENKVLKYNTDKFTRKIIANKLNISTATVGRILRKYKRTKITSHNLESYDKRDLLFINNEESNYWEGFLAADGALCSTSNNISLSLAAKDKEHIEKFALFIDTSVKKRIHNKYNTIEYRAYFNSIKNAKYLNSIGITPNKSKTLNITKSFNIDFLRGVIDGDGSIHKQTGYLTIASASETFAHQVFNYIKSLNFNPTIRKYSNIYIVGLYRQKELKILFKLLYDNKKIFLYRKYKRFKSKVESF